MPLEHGLVRGPGGDGVPDGDDAIAINSGTGAHGIGNFTVATNAGNDTINAGDGYDSVDGGAGYDSAANAEVVANVESTSGGPVIPPVTPAARRSAGKSRRWASRFSRDAGSRPRIAPARPAWW